MKIASILAGAFLLASSVMASGQQPTPISGMMCDKPEHVVEALDLSYKLGNGDNKSARAAVAEVNKKYDVTCALLVVFGFRGEEVLSIDLRPGKVAITEVIVFGLMTPDGPVTLSAPMRVYTGFLKEKNIGV